MNQKPKNPFHYYLLDALNIVSLFSRRTLRKREEEEEEWDSIWNSENRCIPTHFLVMEHKFQNVYADIILSAVGSKQIRMPIRMRVWIRWDYSLSQTEEAVFNSHRKYFLLPNTDSEFADETEAIFY